MSKLTDLTDKFASKLDSFTSACEEQESWDSEKYGNMADFYVQSLMSTMLRVIASDGNISRKEAEFFNVCFDADLTAAQLDKMYDDSEDILSGDDYDSQLREDFDLLKAVSPALADDYRDIWLTACEILIASDGQLLPQEMEDAKHLKSLFM